MDIAHASTVAQREDEGTTVHLADQNGEKMFADDGTTPVTVIVAGSYSSRYRKAAEANRDRLLKQRRTQMDGDTLNRQSLELVAACLIAWDGFTSSGQPYPLTKQNAVALLDACPWIREQVEAAINDHASFFVKS